MRARRFVSAVFGTVLSYLAACGSAGANIVYSFDNGLASTAWGVSSGGNLAWMEQFNVIGGNSAVVGIEVAWGEKVLPGLSGVSAGQSFRWFVWGDPNGDKAPTDANLLAQGTGNISAGSIDTDVFQLVSFPEVGVPDSFFVGVAVDHTPGGYPAAFDETGVSGHSWIGGSSISGGFDPLNPYGGDIGFYSVNADLGWPGSFLLRAIGTSPLQVPEPQTIGLGAISLLALLRYRRSPSGVGPRRGADS